MGPVVFLLALVLGQRECRTLARKAVCDSTMYTFMQQQCVRNCNCRCALLRDASVLLVLCWVVCEGGVTLVLGPARACSFIVLHACGVCVLSATALAEPLMYLTLAARHHRYCSAPINNYSSVRSIPEIPLISDPAPVCVSVGGAVSTP